VNNESPQKALFVVFAVALVCSVLVSVAAITLRPIQRLNELLERSRNIVSLTGLVPVDATLTSDEILEAVEQLDIRVADLDAGDFDSTIDPAQFDERAAAQDPDLSTPIPAEFDTARLGRRSRYVVVYLVWDADDTLERLILPIYGQGMWSTLYGYIALESDLNTVAAVTFYEQGETAGLGDQILRPQWQAQWRGKQIYGPTGAVRFRVSGADAPAGTGNQVDALTGATVTSDAVTALIGYWFGPHGYADFLRHLENQPPVPAAANGSQDDDDA
jgi:Na+-transporting NADH:ubiquinone oxidoreductase subunit C